MMAKGQRITAMQPRRLMNLFLRCVSCGRGIGHHRGSALARRGSQNQPNAKLLYVAAPGIRNYLEHGGHGILVFDINDGHKFVKRILSAGFDTNGVPLNVKGICASAATARLYVSTLQTLMCFDLVSDKLLWENHTKAAATAWRFRPTGNHSPAIAGKGALAHR